MVLSDEGDSRPVTYVVIHHLLFEEDVELVGFPVVQWRTAGREIDRDVVDFAVFSAEGAADDTVDAVAVAEVLVEPCANQSLGGRKVRLVSFISASCVAGRCQLGICT